MRNSEAVKLYGPGILDLPVGFSKARTVREQIDILYAAADSPRVSRAKAEKHLRLIKKLKTKNPDSVDNLERAGEMSKAFHGREPKEIDDVVETYKYPTNLTKLGNLTEIEIECDEGKSVCPIEFKGVDLCCTPDGKQLYFVGGNQKIDLEDLGIEEDGKQFYELGCCVTISYFTDKHHLEGSRSQANGAEYIHEFGEEGGEQPMVIYDCLNARFQLAGGSYRVEEEGIKD